MKMIFRMKSGRRHKIDIGDMREAFAEEIRDTFTNGHNAFALAWTKVDGVTVKEIVLNVNEVESVEFK